MDATEHKALELADRLQQDFNSEYINWDNVIEAAHELRRLYAFEAEATDRLASNSEAMAWAADEIHSLRAQVVALQKMLPWVGNGVQCSSAIEAKDATQ